MGAVISLFRPNPYKSEPDRAKKRALGWAFGLQAFCILMVHRLQKDEAELCMLVLNLSIDIYVFLWAFIISIISYLSIYS
jgi:hypothetical protein